jgi:hypothetical protein
VHLRPATAKTRPEAKFGVNMALLSFSRLGPQVTKPMGKAGSRQTKTGAKKLKAEIQILGAQRRSVIFDRPSGQHGGLQVHGTKQIRF